MRRAEVLQLKEKLSLTYYLKPLAYKKGLVLYRYKQTMAGHQQCQPQ